MNVNMRSEKLREAKVRKIEKHSGRKKKDGNVLIHANEKACVCVFSLYVSASFAENK